MLAKVKINFSLLVRSALFKIRMHNSGREIEYLILSIFETIPAAHYNLFTLIICQIIKIRWVKRIYTAIRVRAFIYNQQLMHGEIISFERLPIII